MSAILRIDGEVERPLDLTFQDLKSIDERDHVRDVSQFHPKRKGDGVTLNSVLEQVRPKPTATYLTLHATADKFAASVPLSAVRDEGIVVYTLDGGPLPTSNGGPIRFLIRNPAACHTDELDDCANVKFVDRIELTAGRGHDTRPENEEEHEHLHEHG
ncbi:MAG: molybdopterin-dependent oxidoreductase [Planctomycetales bacterium]|nr:molybdopterin-dependent oxidoreductase [Planctomycetales bacterium]